MASTVKVPLLGQQNKGTVIGVTLGGVTIAGYMIYRRQKKAAALAAASAASAKASSGYGYGAASAASGYGYGNGYYGYGNGVATSPYGYGASGGFDAGYYGYGVPYPPGETTQAVAYTTNAQWAQAAINQLQNDGYSAQSVSEALGPYELGQPISAAQESIVQAAIAIEGYPPVPGQSGNPPGFNIQGTTGGGTGGGQTTSPKTITANGTETMAAIARAGGITEKQLIALNPQYASFAKRTLGSGKPVTKGSVWNV